MNPFVKFVLGIGLIVPFYSFGFFSNLLPVIKPGDIVIDQDKTDHMNRSLIKKYYKLKFFEIQESNEVLIDEYNQELNDLIGDKVAREIKVTDLSEVDQKKVENLNRIMKKIDENIEGSDHQTYYKMLVDDRNRTLAFHKQLKMHSEKSSKPMSWTERFALQTELEKLKGDLLLQMNSLFIFQNARAREHEEKIMSKKRKIYEMENLDRLAEGLIQ